MKASYVVAACLIVLTGIAGFVFLAAQSSNIAEPTANSERSATAAV